MNLTRLTDEPHRPGTPAALASLARAADAASRDDAARPGFSRRVGLVAGLRPARDGRAPSVTFVHIAFLAYLGLGWSLRARRFHRGFTAAALVPAQASRRATVGRAKRPEPDEPRAAT